MNSERTRKTTFTAIYMFSMVVSLLICFVGISKGIVNAGWDAKIFCRAGEVIVHGGNPYILSELGTSLSWNYPQVYAFLFHVLCSEFNFLFVYPIWYILLFLIGLGFWLDHKSFFYGLVITSTGFFTLGLVVLSGNLGVVELLIISLSGYWMIKGYHRPAFFMLGTLASLKILPILYLLVYLMFLRSWNSRRSALVWAATGFFLPFLISALMRIDLMAWYFRQLFGLIPGQHSAVNEGGGGNNPSLIFFLSDIFNWSMPSFTNLIISIILLIAISACVYSLANKALPHIPQKYRDEFTLAIGMIAITIAMPRAKPYSFLPALLFVYVLTRYSSILKRAFVLFLISVLPQIIYFTDKYGIANSFTQTWPAFLHGLIILVQNYYPIIFLLILLALILSWAHAEVLYTDNLDADGAT